MQSTTQKNNTGEKNMKAKLFFLSLIVVVLSFSMVLAASTTGADTTVGASESGSSSTVTTVDQDSGNLTYVEVTSETINTDWAGFFGNISGSFLLSDSSANNYYQWTVTSMAGAVVYAANTSIADWTTGNVGPLLAANVPSWVNNNGLSGFNNTFTANETFSSAGYSGGNEIASVPYVTTFNGSGVAGDLKTYALYATSESATIWAGKVVDDASGFNGNTVDYQILLPAQSGTTYTFYTELN